MKKNIIIVLFPIIFFSCKNEEIIVPEKTNFVEGYLFDSENEHPIFGAIVNIGDETDSTDLNGYFSISNVKDGENNIFINHPNYEEYVYDYYSQKDTIFTFFLSVKYVDYFPPFTENKYDYEYMYNHGSPRPSSIKKWGISTWQLVEMDLRNDSIVYKIIESRVDTVVSDDGILWNYIDTLSFNFEIIEDSNHIISSSKFPDNCSFLRYNRIDLEYRSIVCSSSKYMIFENNLGITKIHSGYSSGDDYMYEMYNLRY